MSTNLKNSLNNIFSKEPSSDQKAWGIINQFYHLVLTKMEEDEVTRADLARILGKSRAAISQMFNKSPNLSILKMVEIASAVDLEINLTTMNFMEKSLSRVEKEVIFIPVSQYQKNLYRNDSRSSIKVSSKMSTDVSCNCAGF